MKISDKKFKTMLAAAGISSAMVLTACSAPTASNTTNNNKNYTTDEVYEVNGAKRTKAYKDGEEGYYNNSGVFIPFIFPMKSKEKNSSPSGSAGGIKGGTSSGVNKKPTLKKSNTTSQSGSKVNGGSRGLGSASKGGASS
ncbi:hypothetical protein [Viridibacillus arvi]|uniref:hypothetical protein n=1 Tax=Viridibacillus arvi TaxID=263475 RepID=UPI0034CD9D7E